MQTQIINLFCLPNAGGSAMVYNRWRKYMNNSINIIPVELAGRGKRFREPFYKSFEEAINDIYSQISDKLTQGSFSFFGHSMGCLLSYEIICRHKKITNKEPIHAFFSGQYPPNIIKKAENFSNLSDKDFLERIDSYGGTPKEVLENEELRYRLLQVLRADYNIMKSYKYVNKKNKIGCDISILSGKSDEIVNRCDLVEWVNYTEGKCDIYEFEGGHFFVNNYDIEITNIINSKLITNRE